MEPIIEIGTPIMAPIPVNERITPRVIKTRPITKAAPRPSSSIINKTSFRTVPSRNETSLTGNKIILNKNFILLLLKL
jgi:hypothetical protein